MSRRRSMIKAGQRVNSEGKNHGYTYKVQSDWLDTSIFWNASGVMVSLKNNRREVCNTFSKKLNVILRFRKNILHIGNGIWMLLAFGWLGCCVGCWDLLFNSRDWKSAKLRKWNGIRRMRHAENIMMAVASHNFFLAIWKY